MKGLRQRTHNEILAFNQAKIDKRKAEQAALSKKRAEKVMAREFRNNNIKIDKYITYSNKRINLSKKAFVRLMAEGKTKWGL